MPANTTELEKRLWSAADELRANSKLKSSEYSVLVLGLIFLRYADHKFAQAKAKLTSKSTGRRSIGKTDYQAQGVLYLPEAARFSKLLELPEGADIGKAINEAMRAVEAENDDLKEVLPKTYNKLDKPILVSLLKNFSSIPMEIEGDAFGKIYEYFLGKFAMSEGQKGGEFFTPTSLVKLIVEIIEPFQGRIFDPAAGSGGMFVQSAEFVERHKQSATAISIYGQEKVDETIRLCKMNLAVHGLSGDIKQGNTYYEDIHKCVGAFDFVMANPPFNVNGVDKERLKDDRRYPFGLAKTDNANYLWIQHFYSALNPTGRAGFVMANSAGDARSELEIRKGMLEDRAVDVMVSVGTNFFYTVTLPCTLWFLDRGKKKTGRRDKVLFIDARHIFRQIDRAHRDWTPDQIEFISNVVRLYRGEAVETDAGSQKLTKENFPKGKYADVAGLCKVATIAEIEGQGWSLNPGRYVGVASNEEEFEFNEELDHLNETLERLTGEARTFEERIGAAINRPFTPDEQSLISAKLDEIKGHLSQTQQFAADHAETIERQFEYLRESSERLGRKDWLNNLLGGLVDLAIGLALDPVKLVGCSDWPGQHFNHCGEQPNGTRTRGSHEAVCKRSALQAAVRRSMLLRVQSGGTERR